MESLFSRFDSTRDMQGGVSTAANLYSNASSWRPGNKTSIAET
jgi:hypothetical protein